jgi:hypothetical protein
MSEALTPSLSAEALAFVKAGTPKPAAEAAAAPKPAEEKVVEPKATEAQPPKPARTKTPKAETPLGASGGLVSMSVRVPAEIPDGLVRASADRKIKKQKPWTQQEIIAEALAEWLKRSGYLTVGGGGNG